MKYPQLKVAFIERGIPQVKVARDLGRDPAWMSRIIHGWIDPSAEEKEKLATILGRPESELFPDSDA